MRGLGDMSDGEASAKQKPIEEAGGEEEKENIDVVKLVKETKFGENWLVKQAIELQEKYNEQRAAKPNKEKNGLFATLSRAGGEEEEEISTTFSL